MSDSQSEARRQEEPWSRHGQEEGLEETGQDGDGATLVPSLPELRFPHL